MTFDHLVLADVVSAIVSIVTALGGTAATAAAIATVVQVASLAYTAYSTYSAYKEGKKAESRAKRAELEARERNARRNFRSSVAPKRIVYGRDRLGGAFIFADNPNKEDAILVVSLADHEIEEIEEIYMSEELIETDVNGEAVGKYAGHLWIWPHLGGPGQDLSQDLIDLGCDNVQETDTFEGTACLIIRTRNLIRDFPDAEAQFNAVLKGKNDIFDPRDDSTGWTDNAALCAADYLEKYANHSRDRINADELSASADVCDETVTKKNDLTEKRYTVNGVVISNQEHRQVIPDFALAMAGNIAWVGGEWFIVAGRHRAPEITFDENDILGDFEYVYKGSARDVPNVGKGTFKSPAHNWQSVSIPEYVDAEKITQADGERRELDVTLPFTNSGTMAQRILKIAVNRAQQEEGGSLSMKPGALQIKTTDTANFTIPRHGIEGETYEVRDFTTNLSMDGGSLRFVCNVQIQKYDASIFDYDADTEEQTIPTASARLGEVSSNVPTDLELVDNGSDYTLSWTNPDPSGKSIVHTEIEVCHEDVSFVETCDEYQTSTPTAEDFTFAIPVGNTLTTVRMRTRYDNDTTSQWGSP